MLNGVFMDRCAGATYSSILAWEILWMEEPGGIRFMERQREDLVTKQQLDDQVKWTFCFRVQFLKMKPSTGEVGSVNWGKKKKKHNLKVENYVLFSRQN